MPPVCRLLLIALSLGSLTAHATAVPPADSAATQRTIVGLSVTGLTNKARLKVERQIGRKTAVGAFAAYYYGVYPGAQLTPFARLYFGPHALRGFYGQVQAAVIAHRRAQDYLAPNPGPMFVSGGAGFGLGHQWRFGPRRCLTLDLMAGLKWYVYPDDLEYGNLDVGIWYLTGPGSVLNGHFSFGYAF